MASFLFLFIFSILWFMRTIKSALFWLYLWQLKEYHIGRFLDHFRTAKGRYIFLNWLFGAKIALLVGFVLRPALFFEGVMVFYAIEAVKALADFARGAARKPVLTSKMRLISFFVLGVAAAAPVMIFALFRDAFFLFPLGLLLFDIFLPVIISAIVLGFQPFAVLGRRRTIEGAKQKRAIFSNTVVIGITGSYGKTSTKEFLAAILSAKFNVCKTKKHQNSEIGVAQCVLNDLRPEHEIFIAEMGAYGRGGIKLLCDIVKPRIGILTGINEQHMATFGSQENIIKTKFELIESLPEDGAAIMNWDNKFIKSKIQNLKPKINSKSQIQKYKIIKYSTKTREDVWAKDIRIEKEHIYFRGCSKDGDCAEFRVNALGVHCVPNILAAAACAKELDMNLSEIARACEKVTPKLAGMELKKSAGGMNIIDATYSANPDGVISHLEYVKIWSGKKIIVMPCLIELGKASKNVHLRIGRKIGEVCDLAIIITKDKFKELNDGAVSSGMAEDKILFLEDSVKIANKIKDIAGKEDIILLESRLPRQLIGLLGK